MENTLSYLLRLPKFEHLQAKTVSEACSFLSEYKGNARVIAGGTDLLVSMKRREINTRYLINLKTIPGLDYIHGNGEGLRIGALATIHAIESSPVIREKFTMLADTAHQIGTPHIRNMGTIGGNLCHAAPSADIAPVLIGLGASVKIVGLNGERTCRAEDFFLGPGECVLDTEEIMTEIQVPGTPAHTWGVYLKLPARTAIDIAVVGVAVILRLEAGKIVDGKIVLGAVAPTPVRAGKAEEILKGKVVSDGLIEKAAQAAAEEAEPISDIRGSADYRREMVKVLTGRALKQVIALAH